MILSGVLSMMFSDTKKFLKHWMFVLRKCFVTMRHNNSEVLLHSLPLFHPKIVSILECLWNPEGYSTKGFATVGRQIVILPSPFYPQSLSILDGFWTTDGFPYETLRDCETKQFRRKTVIGAPPLLSLKILETRNFFSKSEVCSESVCCNMTGKSFWRRIVIVLPPLLSINTLDTRSILKQRRGPIRKNSVFSDEKIWRECFDRHPLHFSPR